MSPEDKELNKLSWQGTLVSVQPRIRLLRSFDQRNHSYLGYALRVSGVVGDEEREFLVGVGKGAQAKHEFHAGDVVSGQCLPVQDGRTETVEFYKVSKLKLLERAQKEHQEPPPWCGVPPELPIYRERGHRRLDTRTYEAKCSSCIWGCRMAVEMGYIAPDSMRLRDFTKDSLVRTGDQIRESTQRETKSAMKDFITTIGNIDFRSVNLAHGELYLQTCLDRGNTKGTIAKKLRHIKRVFKLAVNRKQLDENPLQYIAMPKSSKKKINIYTDDQCRRILKAVQEHTAEWGSKISVKWDLIITVALATAMRRAELLNCTWADIDFDAQTIEVNPKENTRDTWEWLIKDSDHRTLPLTEEIVQMLVDHQSQQPEGYPYVFVPPARYDHIQNVLRPKSKWTLSDSRLKVDASLTILVFKRRLKDRCRRAAAETVEDS